MYSLHLLETLFAIGHYPKNQCRILLSLILLYKCLLCGHPLLFCHMISVGAIVMKDLER